MGKVFAIIMATLFACLSPLHSQQVRQLTFRITTLDNQEISGKKAYLSKQGTIFTDEVIVNGFVSFQVDGKVSMEDIYLVTRQADDFVSRVRLDALLKSNHSVALPLMRVQMVENKLFDGTISTSLTPIEHHRLWGGGYSREFIEGVFGENHWYYPTELLVSNDSVFDAYYSHYLNARFYDDYGYYPQKSIIDSIKDALAFHSAECLVGWYSRQLIQLQEPVMCNGYSQNAYRFVWSGGQKMQYFTYDPYSFRIELDSLGRGVLYCSYCLYDACDENQVYGDVVFMNKTKTEEFLELIKKLCFWTCKPKNDNGGNSYILEANIDGNYHVIFRGEGEDPALDELQKFLWSLTGLGENKIVHKRQRIE